MILVQHFVLCAGAAGRRDEKKRRRGKKNRGNFGGDAPFINFECFWFWHALIFLIFIYISLSIESPFRPSPAHLLRIPAHLSSHIFVYTSLELRRLFLIEWS